MTDSVLKGLRTAFKVGIRIFVGMLLLILAANVLPDSCTTGIGVFYVICGMYAIGKVILKEADII